MRQYYTSSICNTLEIALTLFLLLQRQIYLRLRDGGGGGGGEERSSVQHPDRVVALIRN